MLKILAKIAMLIY